MEGILLVAMSTKKVRHSSSEAGVISKVSKCANPTAWRSCAEKTEESVGPKGWRGKDTWARWGPVGDGGEETDARAALEGRDKETLGDAMDVGTKGMREVTPMVGGGPDKRDTRGAEVVGRHGVEGEGEAAMGGGRVETGAPKVDVGGKVE